MKTPAPAPKLPADEWDFHDVPKALAAECLEYELAREYARAVPAIAKAAARWRKNPKAPEPKFGTVAERCEWTARHWLQVCQGYPETPWMARWRAKGKPDAQEPMQAHRVAFERGSIADLAGKDSRRLSRFHLDLKGAKWIGPELQPTDYNLNFEVAVFKVNWRCTNKEILADVQRFLEANRPKGLKNTPGPDTNDPRSVLEWLGSLRLIQSGMTAREIIDSKARNGSEKTIYSDVAKVKPILADKLQSHGLI